MGDLVVAGVAFDAEVLEATRLSSFKSGFDPWLRVQLSFARRPVDRPLWSVPLPSGNVASVAEDESGYVAEDHGPVANRTLLRLILAREVARRGGLVLHASGIKVGDLAWLFLGRSGAGKTTIAMQADGELLSDDTVVVLPLGGRFVAFGTPFMSQDGRTGSPIDAPIGALCLLRWSAKLCVTPESQRGLLASMFRSVFLPPSHDALLANVTKTAMGLAASVPGCVLSFPRDYSFRPEDLGSSVATQAGSENAR